MKNSFFKTFSTVAAAAAAAALILALFVALDASSAIAASFVNTAVPSNTGLASGLLLRYSFDGTKVSGTTVTDESGNGKTATTNTYTWNPNDKTTSTTLSGGNLVTAQTAATQGVRATLGRSSGKWYWETVMNSHTGDVSWAVGAGTSAYTLGSIGMDALLSVGYGSINTGETVGSLRYSSADHTGFAAYTTGDVVGVALDLDSHTIYFYKNNVLIGSVSSLSAGTWYPAVEAVFLYSAGTNTFTTNFGATPFRYTPPTGYTGWYTLPLRTPGKIGQALKFDGITASTTIGSVSSSLKSVAFWAKVATSTTQQNIIDLNGAGANIEIVNGVVTANGFTSPTIYVDGAVTSTLSDTNWHHVVVTTATAVNASNVSLGVVGGNYYGGTLDDLRMYNRTLSAAEVRRLYGLGGTSYINTAVPSNTGLSTAGSGTNGLVLHYSFDGTKVSGTTVTDESGNGKTGTYFPADPNFSSVALLLHMNGTNGSTVFTDSEFIPKTVTANGSAQISTTQSKFGGASGYFNGTTSWLSVPASTDWAFGTGDFTVEAWVYLNSNTTEQLIVGTNNGAGGFGAKLSGSGNSSKVSIWLDGSYYQGSANPSTGAWHHLAWVRSGTAVTTYVDGVGTSAGVSSNNITNTSDVLGVGQWGKAGNGEPLNGYIDDLRITKGVARYTANFTPPALALPNIPGTTLAKVPGKIGQALKFDGITASTTVGSVSSSLKSVAFWAKVATSTTQQNIIDLNGTGTNIEIINGVVTANGFTSPTIYVDGAVSSTLNNTNWHHVVVTTATAVNASNVSLGVVGGNYYGGTLDDLRMYNRTLSAAEVRRLYGLGGTSYINTAVPSNTGLSTAGSGTNGLVLDYSFDGTKVSGTTVTDESGNGKTGTTNNDIYANSVKLALHMDGTNGSTVFTDSEFIPKTVTANGSAQISTAQSKFGGASGLFNGTTDYLTTPDSNDWFLGTGDFTIEMWFYLTSFTSGQYITLLSQGADTNNSLLFQILENGATDYWAIGDAEGGVVIFNASGPLGAINTGTWNHFAISRSGSNIRFFLNGVLGSTQTGVSASLGNQTGNFNVGRNNVSNNQYLPGYLDDLRITKGVGRYTATFTPPVNAFTLTPVLNVPGRIGQALKFDGITASTTVGNVSSSLKSVAFWAKVATSTTQQNIIDLNGTGTNIEIINGTVTANGFTSPTIYVDGAVSSTLNNTNWHHVVVTTATAVNASSVNLGVVGTTYYGGTLDDLRMYNRSLSAAEVKRLYGLGN